MCSHTFVYLYVLLTVLHYSLRCAPLETYHSNAGGEVHVSCSLLNTAHAIPNRRAQAKRLPCGGISLGSRMQVSFSGARVIFSINCARSSTKTSAPLPPSWKSTMRRWWTCLYGINHAAQGASLHDGIVPGADGQACGVIVIDPPQNVRIPCRDSSGWWVHRNWCLFLWSRNVGIRRPKGALFNENQLKNVPSRKTDHHITLHTLTGGAVHHP